MIRKLSLAVLALAAFSAHPVLADDHAQAIYDKVSPSLVAVQFTYAGETVQRDFIVPGIVVSDSGLVMIPINLIGQMPDEQLTKFKIIIPHLDRDNEEVDAVFQGRDERADVAFVKAGEPKAAEAEKPEKPEKPDKQKAGKKAGKDGDDKDGDDKDDADKDDADKDDKAGKVEKAVKPGHDKQKVEKDDDENKDKDKDDKEMKDAGKGDAEKAGPKPPAAPIKWTPLAFSDEKPAVGDAVYTVGMLAKSGGYHTFLTRSMVAAQLRGPVKQTMVSEGGLGSPFAPVLTADGNAVGLVNYSGTGELLLDDTKPDQESAQSRFLSELSTNKYFKVGSEFSYALKDPPTPGHPVPLPFSGLMEMSGLGKNDAALFGLENKVAVQINDILPGSPADKAGLKNKQVITLVDGQPIERGDMPDEAVGILQRMLLKKNPGDVVTFTVVDAKDKPARQVKVTLAPYPKRELTAERYYTDEIGFGVREMVPLDRYRLKLKKDEKDGVLVTALKQGGSAVSAGLRPNDMITKINDEPVTSLEAFKTSYEGFRKDHEHDAIVLQVHRVGGTDETIRIEPPQ
jgi:S1-C subfamily serine protease